MSKTQQVKQYKKQIEQLNNEVIAYKVTAEAHMSQVCIVTDIRSHAHTNTHSDMHIQSH